MGMRFPAPFRLGLGRSCAASLAATAVVILAPARGLAADYGAEIDVESEADLYELAATGAIADDALETLLRLLRSPVDINRASRDGLYALPGLTWAEVDGVLAHRRAAGFIAEPAGLVAAGVLDGERLRRLLPFLAPIARPGARPRSAGQVELRARYMRDDPLPPPVLFRGRLAGRGLSFGIAAVTSRLRIGPPSYDSAAGALVAAPPGYRAGVPKLFLSFTRGRLSVVAGSFRIGFGERLTLDTTSRRTPDGAYPDDLIAESDASAGLCRYSAAGGAEPVCAEKGLVGRYTTPDFHWQDGFRGIAASARGLALGPRVSLALDGFASYQLRSVYQYEIADRGTCPDPDAVTAECAAPPVFDASNRARRFAYVTLPDVYGELAGGGRIGLEIGRRAEVGVLGYRAMPHWRVAGVDLDFRPSSPLPSGGPFGAVGMYGALGAGALHFSVEGTRSFDRTPEGGGFGVVERSVWSRAASEVELSLRYYAHGFANPHARPVSAADELDGLRARNEMGARLAVLGRPTKRWRLRLQVDLWKQPGGDAANADVRGRAVFAPLPWLELSSFLDYVNKDLGRNGSGLCYDATATEVGSDNAGQGRGCHGESGRLTGRIAFATLTRRLFAAVQYGRALVTDPRYPTWYRQDARLAAEIGARLTERVQLRARCRYLNQAQDDASYGDRVFASSLDLLVTAHPLFAVRVRYGAVAYLDRRPSTLARHPNPEQRMHLDLESRF